MRKPEQLHTRRFRSTQAGFTLMELMFTVIVLGILLGLAVPTFTEVTRNNRIIAQANEFVGALNYARSEAVKRATSVSLCPTSDNATCNADADWSVGYMVFFDTNANGALDGAERLLQTYPATSQEIALNVAIGTTFVRYQPNGTSAGSSTFSLLRTGCTGLKARNISINTTGRIATTTVACP